MNSARAVAFVCLVFGNLFGQAAIPSQGPATVAAESNSRSATATSPAHAATRVHFIPVLISVTDRKGNPMVELTKEQLKILDDNQAAQPLRLLKAADIPLHLGI